MANKICVLLGAAGVLALGTAASANITDPFILISASNGSGSGSFQVALGDTSPGPNGSTTYTLAAPVDIMDGPNVVATITQLTSTIRPLFGAQPNTISLSFTFLAGSSDTRFVVDSATFTFDPILDEAGRATAGVTITDSGNDGVTSTGNFGGDHYRARGNGSSFADLLAGPLSAGPGQGTNANDRTPPGSGFTPFGGNVDDMNVSWDFTLTAGDQIGVTSSAFIIPAPGAVALLGLAGLTMGRRNRR